MKGVIFVVSLTSDRTDFYEKFTAFLRQLFTENQIKRNTIVLVTKGDEFKREKLEQKFQIIQEEVARLKQTNQWNLEIVQ